LNGSIDIYEYQAGGLVGRLVDGCIHFVAQAVTHGQARRRFPGVLKICIVSFAPDGTPAKVIALRQEFWRY
jgi:hypothetical protein